MVVISAWGSRAIAIGQFRRGDTRGGQGISAQGVDSAVCRWASCHGQVGSKTTKKNIFGDIRAILEYPNNIYTLPFDCTSIMPLLYKFKQLWILVHHRFSIVYAFVLNEIICV